MCLSSLKIFPCVFVVFKDISLFICRLKRCFLVFQKHSEPVKLKRTVGVLSASALVFGSCVGAGIFISPKGTFYKFNILAFFDVKYNKSGEEFNHIHFDT